MNILIPVLIVTVIGALAGLGLAIASIVMAVPVNKKAEAIRQALPGANCGACGYSGCDAYAKALADGGKQTNLCAPGGAAVTEEIAAILGVAAGATHPKTAVVRCQGRICNTKTQYDYEGVKSCKMAAQLFGGPGSCKYGCLGFGDCAAACDYDAIRICDGVAVVDPAKCKACRTCVAACPKSLIQVAPMEEPKALVLCCNHDKGGVTRKVCSTGCIGCMKCQKLCPTGAIKVHDSAAYVTTELCNGCGECQKVCPTGCITLFPGQ